MEVCDFVSHRPAGLGGKPMVSLVGASNQENVLMLARGIVFFFYYLFFSCCPLQPALFF
jgi:hypothetical protein